MASTSPAVLDREGAFTRPETAQNRIEGGYRTITTLQLTMAWWLYQSGQITRRQLRVYFAAHEMAERRRAGGEASGHMGITLRPYAQKQSNRGRRPSYGPEELAALVGGRGSPKAQDDLRGDVKRLASIGLVTIQAHSIEFAVSADQLRIDDLSGFWSLLEKMPNQRRSVPVPRRTLRALAAGFSRAVTGVMLAMLIRSLFWHRESGSYRLDGRTKGSWIAQTFGLSRRAVTDARARLIELGWLAPIETPQWQLNRWGAHDAINPAWSDAANESASPSAVFSGESASPCLNSPLSLRESSNTRNPDAPDRTGVSRTSTEKAKAACQAVSPTLRDVQPGNLARMEDLLDLHRQAVEAKLIDGGEGSQLDFIAYAERARSHGTRPGALFMWLLRGRQTKFITQADEDAAVARLREYRAQNEHRSFRGAAEQGREPELTEDARIYVACIRVAKQQRIEDPFRVAMITHRWTRDRWDAAQVAFEAGKGATSSTQAVFRRLNLAPGSAMDSIFANPSRNAHLSLEGEAKRVEY